MCCPPVRWAVAVFSLWKLFLGVQLLRDLKCDGFFVYLSFRHFASPLPPDLLFVWMWRGIKMEREAQSVFSQGLKLSHAVSCWTLTGWNEEADFCCSSLKCVNVQYWSLRVMGSQNLTHFSLWSSLFFLYECFSLSVDLNGVQTYMLCYTHTASILLCKHDWPVNWKHSSFLFTTNHDTRANDYLSINLTSSGFLFCPTNTKNPLHIQFVIICNWRTNRFRTN